MKEWSRTDLTATAAQILAQKFAHLNGIITAGALNGPYVLTTSTVAADGITGTIYTSSPLGYYVIALHNGQNP